MAHDPTAWLVYAVAWLVFGFLHSYLAGDGPKRRFAGALGARYRLAYNVFASISIAVVFWIGHAAFAETSRFELTGALKLLLSALAIGGWFLLFLALTRYDLGIFAGTAQIRAAKKDIPIDEDGPLKKEGLHRYVRHPLYSAAFMILWGAAWTPLGLATAVYGSMYLLIGTVFEERRLLIRYGEAYASYRRQVPAFIPWKGRVANPAD